MATTNKDFIVKHGLRVGTEGITFSDNTTQVTASVPANIDGGTPTTPFLIQVRRGTGTAWNDEDPVLDSGEFGYNTTNGGIKVGNGTSTWSNLDYIINDSSLSTSLGDYIALSEKGSAGGVATLDGNALVPTNQLPIQTTDDLSEGTTNKYFTQSAARNSVSGGTGLDYNSGTGVFDIDSTVTTNTGTQTLENKTISYTNNTLTIQVGNISDLTATASELNTLDGITASTSELNILDGVTVTASELNILDGATLTTTELNYVDGVTSSIQNQLNDKAPLASPTFTGTVTLPSGTVTSSMIADGTIVNDDINASAGIALSKLATDPLARVNHTGTQAASTISDFDTQVRTSKVTDLATPTSSFSMNSQKITNLAAPTSANDAATMAYVDAATAGLNVHASVKVATTGHVNINNGLENGDTIDGVTLATGNRVLVKNQNTSADNGIYVVQNNGAAVRATDYNSVPNVNAGDFIYVELGTVNNKTGWVQTENPTTIGTDNILFTQFSGAGTYTANNGLTLTGNQFSINTAITADLSTAQTLTNKTINLTSNTLSGTTSQFNTALSDGDFATLAGPETLTNKTISGSSNTLTNIANSSLTNSSVTVNGTSISLGASGTVTVPVSTGISGLGTGIATFLATPSAANLASAVTDETGSGSLVFANTPTLITPNIGAATGTSLTVTGGGLLARQTSNQDGVEIRGRAGGTGNWEVVLTPTTLSADRTITLPNATGTVSLLDNTETLSNKTLAGAVATTAFTLNATAELRLADTDSSHYVGFKSPATVTTNKIWTLPSVDGTSGQVLATDGTGTLSWTDAGGAGADVIMVIMGAY